MTWEQEVFALLDDLEAQADAAFALEREAELADRRRAEYQQVRLAGRLMASVGAPVVLEVAGVGVLEGTLERVADGWLLLGGAGQDWLVRLAALASVRGASERAVPDVAWPRVARLGLGSALRRLADAGERCVVHGVDGGCHDGVPVRVGADFVEIVPDGSDRVTLVAFDRLAAVQRRG